ncbi:MAG: hypothetical protein GEU91_14180 [Rhizobiales bacterium]|nr:hypothetical protein [Hyphomicrobiales bacterium]
MTSKPSQGGSYIRREDGTLERVESTQPAERGRKTGAAAPAARPGKPPAPKRVSKENDHG